MIEALQGVDVVTGPQIIQNAVEVAAGCPDLKLLQITSAGFDEFNFGGPEVMEGLRQHGVIFANNGGSNAIGVAETTIMLMLGVCKNMFELALMARSGVWTEHHTRLNVRGAAGARELSSQTVGIVGFGNIGRMVARYLQGFRCKVLYHDTQELMVGRDGELDAEYVRSGRRKLLSAPIRIGVPLLSFATIVPSLD
jgi:phosphoglycerate dehydrogenase-like enzyme